MAYQPYMPTSNGALLPQCSHKNHTGCILTATPNCCACNDQRPNAPAYPVYVDGEGVRYQGTRWGMYCWKCREYWTAISFGPCSPTSPFATSHLQPSQASPPSHHTTPSRDDPEILEHQTQRLTRLRTELQGVRTGIQRIVSGLQELGEDTTQPQASLRPPDMASSGHVPTSTNAGQREPNSFAAVPWAPPLSATSPTRYFSDPVQRQRHSDLIARQRAFLESNQPSPHLTSRTGHHGPSAAQQVRRTNTRQEPVAAALGTREDVEQPDYQSPVGQMFARAYDRYRTAEETRRQATSADTQDRHDAFHAELAAAVPNPLVSHGHLASFAASVDNSNPFLTPSQPMHRGVRYRPGEPRSQVGTTTSTAEAENLFYHQEMQRQNGLHGRERASVQSGHRAVRRSYGTTEAEHHLHRRPAPALPSTFDPTEYLAWAQSHHPGVMPTSQPLYEPYDESESDAEPVTFDTQERPPPMKPESMMVDLACTICKEHVVDTVVMPCMHAVMCNWCAELQIPGRRGAPTLARDRSAKCPVCRARVKERRKIFHA